MQLINTTSGKIGHYVVGPKHYLNINIRLGETALCIARDANRSAKQFVWLIGGVEQLIDYLTLARSENTLNEQVVNLLLSKIDEAKAKSPRSHEERLASMLSMEVKDLQEIITMAQVSVSAPINGIQDYSGMQPKWIPRNTSYSSIH